MATDVRGTRRQTAADVRPTRCARVAGDLCVEWRGRGRYPPGPSGFSLARTLTDRPRPAAAPARRLRRVRADLQHAPAAHPGRLHARPGGQPLRHRRPPGELPLARVELRRPDPAARRRPADDRRRLPRPRPGDHAARLPPRAGRGLGGGDDRRGRGRRSRACARARSSTSTTGCATLAMRIAMRALLGLDPDEAGKGAAAAEHFERALDFYGIDFALRFLRGPGSPWRKMLASRAGARRDRLRRDRPAPGRPRPATGWTSSACCSASATRPARASPTARSATS